MSRALSVVVVGTMTSLFVFGPADAGGGVNTNGGGDSASGRVAAWASQAPVVTPGSSGPTCRWSRMTRGQVIGLAPSQGPSGLTPEERSEVFSIMFRGVEHRLYSVVCPDGSFLRIVPVTTNPGSLEDPLRDYADRIIELPVPNVNPTIESGGIVNLGMWLAVEERTYEPITAEAGLAWMAIAPALGETTFTFGNGDDESCGGAGTPIVDLDVIGEGECGYTYEQPGAYSLSITTTWLLPYTSSAGPGALEPLVRTVTYDYEVREIQTVGTSN